MEFQKKIKLRLRSAIASIVIGLALILVEAVAKTGNNFLPAFGFGLILNALLRLRQYRRITKDAESLKRQETAETDERNIQLAEKARSWAFSLYILLTGAAVIVLSLFNRVDAAQPYALSICLLVVLYWLSSIYLHKKY